MFHISDPHVRSCQQHPLQERSRFFLVHEFYIAILSSERLSMKLFPLRRIKDVTTVNIKYFNLGKPHFISSFLTLILKKSSA